ncbi:Protein NRT1/ PTR FAMILY 6.2 [Hibiscus syriacus]|uniref:Protein NRT1/ PTR FAMILY 6.2 n=1 Tax=Hibiscus syriacus TaxID=106335 RepID=A0A6A2XKN2_HIBSY|nr:Protein NRT1/ PTR FAMILY 6.2 [Hibiscus syriacus]
MAEKMSLTVADAVDYKGFPADRSITGGWVPAALSLGIEICERLATMGIAVNLVTYLGGKYALSKCYFCKCCDRLHGDLVYSVFTWWIPCRLVLETILNDRDIRLGSDAWDFPVSCINKTAATSAASLPRCRLLVYIQDEVGRSWGYGICSASTFVALVVFFSGTKRYRYKKCSGSPVAHISQVVSAAFRKKKAKLPSDISLLYEDLPEASRIRHTNQLRFLDKASVVTEDDDGHNGSFMVNPWKLCPVTRVEVVKKMIRLLPIWVTTILFWTTYAQMITFSAEQATTMKRNIGNFLIPAGSLTVFFVGAILISLAFYDRFIIPLWKKMERQTWVNKSATDSHRPLPVCHGNGSCSHSRGETAIEGLIYTGQLDFFITQSPKGMKTISTGLFLTTLSLGFFFSSLLVSVVKVAIRSGGKQGWVVENINKGRLDFFYGLLAALSFINFGLFLLSAAWFRKTTCKQAPETEIVRSTSFAHESNWNLLDPCSHPNLHMQMQLLSLLPLMVNVVLDESNYLLWKQQVLLTVHLLLTRRMKFLGTRQCSCLMATVNDQCSTAASINWKGDDSMRVYLTRIKEVCDALASCGSSVSQVEHVVKTQLAGFDAQPENLPMSASVAQGQLHGVSTRSAASHEFKQQSSTIRSGRTGGRGRARLQCQLCGKNGHSVDRCWYRFDRDFAGVLSTSARSQYKDELSSVNYVNLNNAACTCCANKNGAGVVSTQTTVAPAAALNSSRTQWIVDSGATHHVTPDASHINHSTDLDGPGNLVVGNGTSLAVKSVVSKLVRDYHIYFEFHADGCSVRDEVTCKVILRGRQTDACMRHIWVYLLKNKSQAITAFRLFKTMVQTQFSLPIKAIQSDWGGEYRNWSDELAHEGVLHRVTCPYSSEQNGVVERKHRHLIELALVLLARASLPIKFWSYVVTTAAYLINRLPTKVLHNVSPFEKLFARKPDYNTMRVFGCRCFPYLRDFQSHKLMPRSQECVFLGYSPQHRGFQCLVIKQCTGQQTVPSTRSAALKITPRRHAECSHDVVHSMDSSSIPSQTSHDENDTSLVNVVPAHSNHSTAALLLSTTPMIYTEESSEHQSLEVDNVPTLDSAIPVNIHQALQPTQWTSAVHDELAALQQNGTWSLVSLPYRRIAVECKWLFKLKKNPDGTIQQYKARLVAQGFSQVPGQDFKETFSPVLSEEVFMKQPPGFEKVAEDGTKLVCKLHKSLYGLRQAPRKWNNKLKQSLLQMGFRMSKSTVAIDRVVCALQVNFSLKDLAKSGMSKATPTSTPMVVSNKLQKETGKLVDGAREFRSTFGALRYACHMRPDIVYSVIAQIVHEPCENHLLAAKRILRYLAGTIEYGLVFKPSKEAMRVTAFAYADWGGCVDDQRSMSDLDVHFVREKIAGNQLVISYVPTTHQLVDGFTKPLSKIPFASFREKVHVCLAKEGREEEAGGMLDE